jgi:hypothetical protein
VAGILAAWSWRNQKLSGLQPSMVRSVASAFLPFALLTYGGIAFLTYGIWCDMRRHVDPGIGDLWTVPVGNGYSFCMTDVPEGAYLQKDGCSGSPLVGGITDLVEADQRILGISSSAGAFVFDTRSNTLETFADLSIALRQFSSTPTLQTAKEFHMQRRWGWPDLAALSSIMVSGLLLVCFWYKTFIRAP